MDLYTSTIHTMTETEMPDDVRHAFLEILYYTLIHIRATRDPELSSTLAYHAHNIPHLIDRYTPELFRYYWTIERTEFIRAMDQLGQPFDSFQEHWVVLGRHYEGCRTGNQPLGAA